MSGNTTNTPSEQGRYAPGAYVSPDGRVLAPWFVVAYEAARNRLEQAPASPESAIADDMLAALGELAATPEH